MSDKGTSLVTRVSTFLTASRDCLDNAVVDTCLLAEVFALPTEALLSFVGPQCTEEALKARSNSIKWLFEDSKIQPRRKDAQIADTLCSLLYAFAQLDKHMKELDVECKNQAQNQIGGSEQLRYEVLNSKLRQVTVSWDHVLRKIVNIFEPIVAEKGAEVVPEIMPAPAESPAEALEYFEKYMAAPPPVSTRRLEANIQQQTTPEEMMSSLTDALKTLNEATEYSLFRQRVEIWNTNCKKISNKKKNVNWSLKFGRGLEEFLSAPRGSMTYSQALVPRNQTMRKPKVPKGCLDFEPSQMKLREAIFDKIKAIFRLYGAEPIDTPVFELKEVLTGKYGEDQKLIYDLKDQGGEQLGLRYDLTVPFARFCATNSIEKIRRYHIGKVYRRDEPQVARGRLREFYQCDVDIAGSYDCMSAESEILTMLLHLLDTLNPIIGRYKVKVSHRAFLDGMMSLAGVPTEKLRAISSAIDKLDKEEWSTVEAEMCEEKGLSRDVAQKLKAFVTMSGPYKTVRSQLTQIPGVETSEDLKRALQELDLLYSLMEVIPNVDEVLVFDASLARGLDYYTGLIYEAVLCAEDEKVLGSIAAGGRYDGLIGLFSAKSIPAVGVSLGIERVCRLVESKFTIRGSKIISRADPEKFAFTNKSDVYILSVGNGMIKEKLKIATMLRQKDIRVEFSLQDKLPIGKQIGHILETGIPIGVSIGQAELESGRFKVKQFVEDGTGEEAEVALDDLIPTIKRMLESRHDRGSKLEEVFFTSLAS